MDVRIEAEWPESLDAGQVEVDTFGQRMVEAVRTPFDQLVDDIQAATRNDEVRDAYRVEESVQGQETETELHNDHKLWAILEEDTSAHEIPPHWVPIDALMGWSEAHGMNPYAVQWKIAMEGFTHPGTTGDHVVRDTFQRYRSEFDVAVQHGAEEWFTAVLG